MVCIDHLLGRDAVPVGKDMGGDEIDRRGELGMRPIQTVQISPVVTGTGLWRLTR